MKKPIAITLSKRSIAILNELVKESGFESKSRTIEETILSINEIKNHYIWLESVADDKKGFQVDQGAVDGFLNITKANIDRFRGFETKDISKKK